MKCPRCQSCQIRKNGHRRGKQNYQCFDCGRQFVETYSTQGDPSNIKEYCLKMYVNGSGFRAIERITGVNHNTVIRWVKKVAIPIPDAPKVLEIPEITEIDELQTFVGKKKQIVALDSRESRISRNFSLGTWGSLIRNI
uniref:Transposase n=1 Tax=Moorena producens (strain JHB) TaxID=1454205 RepID=A0A1D9GAK3_MOOP1